MEHAVDDAARRPKEPRLTDPQRLPGAVAVDHPRVPCRQKLLDDQRSADGIDAVLPPRADPSTGKARGSRRHVRARRNKLHVRRKRRLVATVPGIHDAYAQEHEQHKGHGDDAREHRVQPPCRRRSPSVGADRSTQRQERPALAVEAALRMAPGTLHSVASDSSAGQQGRGGASVAPEHRRVKATMNPLSTLGAQRTCAEFDKVAGHV